MGSLRWPLRAYIKGTLLLGLVWPEQPLIGYFWDKLPLLVWKQGSEQELLERPQTAKNFYGVRVGHKTINKRIVARGYRAHRIQRKPLLTASHRQLHLDWARRWQNPTVAAWSHVIWGDESHFQLCLVDGRMRVHRLSGEPFQQDGQGPSWRGFCPCWGYSTTFIPRTWSYIADPIWHA